MIGRRTVMTGFAVVPFVGHEAMACQIQLRRPVRVFDEKRQRKHVQIVETFFKRIGESRSWQEIEQSTQKMLRVGFKWPSPQPTKLVSISPFGDLVIVYAEAMESDPENECNPIAHINAYYSFHFDGDQIAIMDTITYG